MFFRKPVYDYESMSLKQAIEHFSSRVGGISSPDARLTQEQLNEILEGFHSALAGNDRRTLWLAEDIRTYLVLHGYSEHDIRPTRLVFDRSYRMYKHPETSKSLLWRTRLSLWWEKLTKLFRR